MQIWDVACQRQVQVEGPDAEKLIQWMTPRDISGANVGDCLYIPIINAEAGMVNDPVLLKLSENKFWLSIADSDVLLYASGMALGGSLDVRVSEPDVYPLAVQGPKAEAVLVSLFGKNIHNIGFFKFDWIQFNGTKQLIARSGYSRQGGFEIYLKGAHLGSDLWRTIVDAGASFNIRPGCPNLIERIEGGLLSYGNEMTSENNPLELGLANFCNLDRAPDCVGLKALLAISNEGVGREMRGVRFDGDRAPTCADPWPVTIDGKKIGQITSAIWSPRLECNIGLSLIDKPHWNPGTELVVSCSDGSNRSGLVSALPFG